MGGRALALVAVGVVLAAAACGNGIIFGNAPPSPVTAASVRAAVDKSTFKNGHFTVTGTFLVNSYTFDVTGDGVLQREPVALLMNLTLPLKGAPTIHEIDIGGRLYTRTGSGNWTSTPDSSTISPTAPTTYVGEERVAGELTWHAQTKDSGSTYDIWVRESDGYIVFIKLSQTKSTVSLAFDTFNQSPVITAP